MLRSKLPAIIPFVVAAALYSQSNVPGLDVKTAAPPFSLKDQKGATQTAKTLMGSQGLMLVFYRSADW